MDFLEIFISRPLLLVNRKHHICKAERRNMLNYTKEINSHRFGRRLLKIIKHKLMRL